MRLYPLCAKAAKKAIAARRWLPACWLILTAASTASADIEFQHHLLEESSPEHDVGAIVTLAQDNQGFIWIGGEYGLARYDGQKTARYSLGEQQGSTYVNDIALDQNGVMWVASERGLSRYREDSNDFILLTPFPSNPSQNRIAGVTTDRDNQIIMARPNGVSIYDQSKQLFKHFDLPSSTKVPVADVMVDHNNNIWLGTHGAGAAMLDRKSNRFRFYQKTPNNPNSLSDDHVTMLMQDQQRRIWIGTKSGGISRLSPNNRRFEHFFYIPDNPRSLGHNYIRDIYEDSSQVIWVATDHGGIARFDEQSNDFTRITHDAFDFSSLSSNQVRKILEDRNGDLWIGAYPKGLNYFNRVATQFTNFSHEPNNPESLSHSAILCFYPESDQYLWVGTEDGLNLFDRSAGTFKRYPSKPGVPGHLQANAVITLEADDPDHLWLGTWSGGLHRFNKRTEQFKNYMPTNNPDSINSAFVWDLARDKKGRLWIGTEGGGLNVYEPATDSFRHFMNDPNDPNSLNHNNIWSMLADHRGDLWIGTTAGLNRFNPETETFQVFPREPDNPYTIDTERVRALYQDSSNRIWIGTQESGLFIYDFNTEKFTQYGTAEGLPATYVTGFVEDDQGFIWATTSNGVAKIAPQTMQITVFNKNHGLVGNNFYRSANYKDDNGNLYLGANDGFSIFNPSEVSQYPADAKVRFTDFSVPGNVNHDTPAPIIEREGGISRVTLPHLSDVFSIEFSALDFRAGSNQKYAYRLEGFDKDWINIHNTHQVTYTNLNPGEYVFKVMAGTLSGWSPHVSELRLTITPPPWSTWWAYAIYLAVISGIILLLVHVKIRHAQLSGERQVNNQLRTLNVMKDAFLANTSHELRTPLNGIIGIAESLRDRPTNQDAYTRRNLELIVNSGKRLANLINDILDYSKLANNKLEVNAAPVDMHKVTQNVFTLLHPLAQDKKIELVNDIEHLAPFVLADENRLQQILINLVGNGIKYTQQGSVTVGYSATGGNAYITVKDTGIGVPATKQKEIFEVFNQVQNYTSRAYDGTGLGLAITRQLVELHGGKIWIENNAGGGSKFIFTLPTPDENSVKPRPVPSTEKMEADSAEAAEEKVSSLPSTPRNARDQTILIVDDDSVNRMVLQGILSLHDYIIIEASSGEQALELLAQYRNIDLVIMDVMMPDIDGFDTCRTIRHTHEFHNLPVIFLTAKSGDEDIQTCFEAGGNDYLIKPVNKNDLLARVANHLRIQSVIRKLQMQMD